MKKVIFISRNKAEDALPKMEDRASIISINSDSNMAKLDAGWLNKHFVVCDDIDRMYGPEDDYHGRQLNLFSEEQAAAILAFVEEVKDSTDIMVVHCDAVISRSGAVAKFIAEKYDLPFNHSYTLYNKHVYRTLWKVANGY